MSTIVFTSLTFTGTPSADDELAARFIVRLENARRAALEPPEAALPTGTMAQLKNSYLIVLLQVVTSAHLSYVSQASRDQTRFTAAQIDQIRFNLNARLDAGEDPATIVADTAA